MKFPISIKLTAKFLEFHIYFLAHSDLIVLIINRILCYMLFHLNDTPWLNYSHINAKPMTAKIIMNISYYSGSLMENFLYRTNRRNIFLNIKFYNSFRYVLWVQESTKWFPIFHDTLINMTNWKYIKMKYNPIIWQRIMIIHYEKVQSYRRSIKYGQ